MVRSTSARPLIPEPPMPMKWIRRARPYMSGLVLVGAVGAGDALAGGPLRRRVGGPLEQVPGDPLGRVGAGEAPRVDRHADQGLPVLEQTHQLEGQALAGEVA